MRLDLTQLRSAARHEGGVSRRLFLAYAGALSSLPLAARVASAGGPVTFPSDPFTLGVASGDPDHQGVVLWTRLAPAPLDPFGGMPPVPVEVTYEVADDEAMTKVVATGTVVATPQLGHSVHAEPTGLRPDRWYHYRFRAGDAVSPVGRTRTLPHPSASPASLKFAFASCQHYEAGYFTAYSEMAKDGLDLVCHLGDYIYEGKEGNSPIRRHLGPEIQTLGDYRVRHAQYRSDPDLKQMHAVCPWFVTWDDHEFDNNCAGAISEESGVDPVDFLVRRADAYQAYYEAMPLRAASLPTGPDMQLYRRASYGRLADLMVLDTRQYRTDQPNDDRKSPLNEAATARENTLLGTTQRNWLYASLLKSESTWNVLAQQVMAGMAALPAADGSGIYSMDQWPGYAHERMELVRFLQDRRVQNPVVLTGDIHQNWVNELRVDDRQADLPVVATEFVGTSISSGGKGAEKPGNHEYVTSQNPCVKFYNGERGYVRCTVTPETWTADYQVVDDVTRPGGAVRTRASFVIEAGRPGVTPA